MQSLKVGHYSNPEKGTGVSVFLLDKPMECAYLMCGASPASRELHTLELEASVPYIDGLVFTGGSAYGLGTTNGVMQWFKEKGRGYKTVYGVVPILPTAAIFDLGEQSALAPTAEEAYQACTNAIYSNHQQGRIGAGTGATIGKLIPNTAHMKGGLGCVEIVLDNGLRVTAYAVVNCVGDVCDASGKIIAGAVSENGKFADCETYLLSGQAETPEFPSNTTLVAIFVNAKFSKPELKRIAKMAISGMAKAIAPAFTRYDGDIIFCVSLGEMEASEIAVGTIAAEAVRQAIINAVVN